MRNAASQKYLKNMYQILVWEMYFKY